MNQKMSGLTENAACALCYVLSVLSPLLLLAAPAYKRNYRVRYNIIQSVCATALLIGITIQADLLAMALPSTLANLVMMLLSLVMICAVGCWFYAIWMNAHGHSFAFPFIGGWSLRVSKQLVRR
ncbi:MAG: hypothetical protein JNK87_38130 [Bryobacterales bacterium]|nr:hypothetical protein [Bryobacterales bacterium]